FHISIFYVDYLTRVLWRELLSLARILDGSPLWLAEGRCPKEPPAYPPLVEPGHPHSTRWPFSTLTAEELSALTDSEKAIVEETLKGLILALKNNRNQ